MTAVPLYDIIEGHPDFDTVYTRCPRCGVVGTSSSADYLRTDAGELDPHTRSVPRPAGPALAVAGRTLRDG
jgi:hypothetical protein